MLRRRLLAPTLAMTLLAVGTGCDSGDGRELPEPGPDQTASIAVTTTIAGATDPAAEVGVADEEAEGAASELAFEFQMFAPWQEAGDIAIDFTCDGLNTSPEVSWVGVPGDAVELAVVMTDLDADGFVHWVAFGIDPTLTALPADAVPAGVAQATNSAGTVGYSGPCPPEGRHAYLLEVYAISQQLEYTDGAPADEVITAIQSSSLLQSSVIGMYQGT